MRGQHQHQHQLHTNSSGCQLREGVVRLLREIFPPHEPTRRNPDREARTRGVRRSTAEGGSYDKKLCCFFNIDSNIFGIKTAMVFYSITSIPTTICKHNGTPMGGVDSVMGRANLGKLKMLFTFRELCCHMNIRSFYVFRVWNTRKAAVKLGSDANKLAQG